MRLAIPQLLYNPVVESGGDVERFKSNFWDLNMEPELLPGSSVNSSSGIRKLLSRCTFVLVLVLVLLVVVLAFVMVVVGAVRVELIGDEVVLAAISNKLFDDDNGVETWICPFPGDGGGFLGLHGIA